MVELHTLKKFLLICINVAYGLEAEVLASEAGRSFEASSDHLTAANDFRL